MIRKGPHPAVVAPVATDLGELACQFGKSKEKLTPFIAVCCEILSGPDAGQKITWWGYFSDNAGASGKTVTDRTLESLRHMGFKGDDLDKFADQRPDIEFQIIVDHEVYDGKTRAKVQWVNSGSSRGIAIEAPMDKKELGLFAARFKTKLKAHPGVEGKKAERQAPTAAPAGGEERGDDPMTDTRGFDQSPPAGSDDDIPF